MVVVEVVVVEVVGDFVDWGIVEEGASGAVALFPRQQRWFWFLLSHLMKVQNFGSFFTSSVSSRFAGLIPCALCVVVASVTKAGKMILESLKSFSWCLSVVTVTRGVVLTGTEGCGVVFVTCSSLLGNWIPIS